MIRKFFAKSFLVLTAITIAITPARCNPLGRIAHYVRTHKELLAYDAIVIAGPMADAASTVHCLHASPLCQEENPALPSRPTNAQVYRYAGTLSLGMIGIGHLWFRVAPLQADRHVIWWWAAPIAAEESMQVNFNINALAQIQAEGK